MSLPAAVLWDMDGTLVDTEPYWIAAEHDIVEEHGGTWTEELAHQLVGQDLLVAATFIRDNSAVDWSPERIVDEMLGRVIGKVSEHIPWRPGARELLEGTIFFAVDPANPRNRVIADLDKAPKNAQGGVECSVTWPQLWAVHLRSRLATRVLVRVQRFRAAS